MVLKFDRRFTSDLTFQWSYVFSKIMTGSDSYFANSETAAQDHYNRRLEKSIGQFDQTHTVKFSTLYNLPFGKGGKYLTRGPLAHVVGGPNVDRFLKPASAFGAQPADFGNATRHNPKVRTPWDVNENISLAKTFRVTEMIRIDLRGEAFNLFNRTIFGTGSTNLNAGNFGIVTSQANTPRQMQVGLKLYW